MKFLVVYNDDFTTSKKFDNADDAFTYIFEEIKKQGTSKEDYKVYEDREIKIKEKSENNDDIIGIQMSIFDLPGMEEFKQVDKKEINKDKETLVSMKLSVDTDKINKTLNDLFKVLNDNEIDFDIENNVLQIDIENLIAENIEFDLKTKKK